MPKLRGSDTDFGHLLKRAFGAAVFCVLKVVVRVGHCSGFFFNQGFFGFISAPEQLFKN